MFFIITFCNPIISQEKSKTNGLQNLNLLEIGYQLGGKTYLGAEYEYRFSKYIGLNLGAGILGYTAGFKFHTCPCRTGPFLNISFKDGYFGKFSTINAELGGVLVFFDKEEKLGLLGQVGFGQILYVSSGYNDKFSKSYNKNDMIMAFGVGLSYYINK